MGAHHRLRPDLQGPLHDPADHPDLGDYTVSNEAGPATGAGAVGTWPTFAPALLGLPIDHVLATANWQVQGLRVIEAEDGAGSDHRPIVATLAPTS